VLNHYQNLWEWNKAHSNVCDFLTLWKKIFLLNTHHNRKPLMWWFNVWFEGLKNITQIFMYYCCRLLESSMCLF
jgi:hypothetical protein